MRSDIMLAEMARDDVVGEVARCEVSVLVEAFPPWPVGTDVELQRAVRHANRVLRAAAHEDTP